MYFSVWFGFLLANFSYQMVGDQNYDVAIERTFFQTAAILATYVANRNWK